MDVYRHTLAALPPEKRYSIHYTWGLVGPRTGLEEGGITRSRRDSIPRPCNSKGVAILTELSRSHIYIYIYIYIKGKVIPITGLCGPEGWYRYSSTLPRLRHKKGVSGQQHAPAALYPRERPGTHFTAGWVGPRVGMDGRKSSSPPGFDPGPSSP